MKSRYQYLIAGGLILLLVSGCATGPKKTRSKSPHSSSGASKTMPSSHMGMKKGAFGAAPGATPPSHQPGSAMTTYNTAVIRVLDKTTNSSKLIELPMNGDKIALEPGKSKIMIQTIKFYSDFSLGEFGAVSLSDTLRNPALRISITEGDKELFLGYLFSKFPDQHTFEHERLKLVLVNVLNK